MGLTTSPSGGGASGIASITGGTATGLTGLGIRSTGAAFDLTLASAEVLTAGRKLTFNVGDADRVLTIPATGTAALLGTANVFTVAQTITPSATGLCLTLNGGIVTTSQPPLLVNQTWNDGGVQFFGPVVDITATACAFNSHLQDWRVGGTAQVWFERFGTVKSTGGFTVEVGGAQKLSLSEGAINLLKTSYLSFSSSDTFSNSPDTYLYRRDPAYFGLGAASATPVTQALGGAEGAGSNITGGTLNIGTRGTGTGTGGAINLQFHAAGSSGSTLGTPVNVLSVVGVGTIRITSIPTSSAGLSSGDVYSNAGILTIVP